MAHPQIGRALRLMNMEKNGTPTVAEFEALLTDQGRVDTFIELLQRPGALEQIAGYPNLAQALAGYPNLAHALAGTDAWMALALSNASFMAAVAQRPSVMLAFINDQSALDTIFSQPDVHAAFLASTALAKASVPNMTSNTAPSGVASASSEFAHHDWYLAFWAFDGMPSDSQFWGAASGTTTNQWLQYSFPSGVFIHTAEISNSVIANAIKDIRIEHSDNDVNFVTAKSVAVNPVGDTVIPIAAPGFHKHWRVLVESTVSGNNPGIKALNFRGFLQP